MTPAHIILLIDAFGVPTGFASTSRVRYLSAALQEAGASVEILLVRPSEQAGFVQNHATAGSWHGIPFRYTTGTSILAGSWFGRRTQEIGGMKRAVAAIRHAAREHPNTCVIAYARHLITVAGVAPMCRQLGIPLVLELCEWPATQPSRTQVERLQKALFCRACLSFADGAVVISHDIRSRIAAFAPTRGEALPTFQIPILGESTEPFTPEIFPALSSPYVLYCGSLTYTRTIQHVISAFALVAGKHPAVNLIIVGSSSDPTRAAECLRHIEQHGLQGRVILAGYISRPALLTAYAKALALLIPLFDDAVSRARFPTKLAEYLFAGRPVVTTNVGEVSDYLADCVNAFVAPIDSVSAFADRLNAALSDHTRAEQIASAGRSVACAKFDYRVHGQPLLDWLGQLKGRSLSPLSPVPEETPLARATDSSRFQEFAFQRDHQAPSPKD